MKKKLIVTLILICLVGLIVWLCIPAPMFKNPDSVWIDLINYETEEEDMISFASNSNIDLIDTDAIADILADGSTWRFPKSHNGHSIVKGDLWISGYALSDSGARSYHIYLNPDNPELNIIEKHYSLGDFSIGISHSIRNSGELYEKIMAVLPPAEEMMEISRKEPTE